MMEWESVYPDHRKRRQSIYRCLILSNFAASFFLPLFFLCQDFTGLFFSGENLIQR